jgi:hypothetical protein
MSHLECAVSPSHSHADHDASLRELMRNIRVEWERCMEASVEEFEIENKKRKVEFVEKCSILETYAAYSMPKIAAKLQTIEAYFERTKESKAASDKYSKEVDPATTKMLQIQKNDRLKLSFSQQVNYLTKILEHLNGKAGDFEISICEEFNRYLDSTAPRFVTVGGIFEWVSRLVSSVCNMEDVESDIVKTDVGSLWRFMKKSSFKNKAVHTIVNRISAAYTRSPSYDESLDPRSIFQKILDAEVCKTRQETEAAFNELESSIRILEEQRRALFVVNSSKELKDRLNNLVMRLQIHQHSLAISELRNRQEEWREITGKSGYYYRFLLSDK